MVLELQVLLLASLEALLLVLLQVLLEAQVLVQVQVLLLSLVLRARRRGGASTPARCSCSGRRNYSTRECTCSECLGAACASCQTNGQG